MTEQALAIWALLRPSQTWGLRRMNSTRKRASPVQRKYCPSTQPGERAPAAERFACRHIHQKISKATRNS